MWAVAIDAEQAAMYSSSEIDIAINVCMVELALMRAPFWKIIYPTVERPVSGQSCQLALENMVRSECGMRCLWHTLWTGLEVVSG
jgi:hypothetical protein